MTNIPKLAASLSEAQRRTVLALTDEWQAGPLLTDAMMPDLKPLQHARLVERAFGDMGIPKTSTDDEGVTIRLSACWWFRLTCLGIAICAHLLQGERKGA